MCLFPLANGRPMAPPDGSCMFARRDVQKGVGRRKGKENVKYNLAILGAGAIAHTMAQTIQSTGIIHGYAVASRDLERSSALAAQFGFEKAYGSYEEMLADPKVDLVYIATPHVFHARQIIMCLGAGKHVLCEKPLTINAEQARRVTAMAREKGLLLAEAIWSRYLPMAKTLKAFAASEKIGRIYGLTANMCLPLFHRERLQKRELGGGALLDVGIYPLTFASLILGDEVTEIHSAADLSDTGVDKSNSILLTYASGAHASIVSSLAGPGNQMGLILGEKGYAEVGGVGVYRYLRVFGPDGKQLEEAVRPPQVTGYEFELAACVQALDNGWLECPDAPHATSVAMMELLERIRKQWGLEYPEL